MASQPTTSSRTQTLVRRVLEAWNSHDLDRIEALYAPDYEGVDVGVRAARLGPEQVRHGWKRYLAAFPDLQFTAEEIVVEDGRAAVSWIATGTHQGVLMHIPPTQRRIEVRGVTLCHFEQDRLAHAVHVWDIAGLLRTLGLLPELP